MHTYDSDVLRITRKLSHLLSWRFVISPKGPAVPAIACMAKVWYPRAGIFAVQHRWTSYEAWLSPSSFLALHPAAVTPVS